MSLARYRWDPAAFIDDYIPLNEKGKPWRLSPHQRKVLNLAMRWAREGREQSLRLLLWAEMKKSGKTLLAGALGLWWAYTRPNTEVITAANDLEQSVGRVFKTMLDLIKRNPSLLKSARLKVAAIELTNGTTSSPSPATTKALPALDTRSSSSMSCGAIRRRTHSVCSKN